jgi:two-component system OmpR family response regulator
VQRQRKPHQKIVVLSNHSSRDVRWRCTQLGADAIFDKSTELEALMDYCAGQRERVQGAEAGEAPLTAKSAEALPAAPA